MPDFLLTPNGIDTETGLPAMSGLTPVELFDAILAEEANQSKDPEAQKQINFETNLHNSYREKLGVLNHINADDLSQAGWGVILPQGTPPAVLENLKPLIEHRRKEANRVYKRDDLYLIDPATSAIKFRNDNNETAGDVDPKKLPYYLLIVGPPAADKNFTLGGIPFEFQHSLGAVHAVGRLHFDDQQGYKEYAENLVAFETSQAAARQAQAAFFSPAHDDSTRQSAQYLVSPLIAALEKFQADFPIERKNKPNLTYQFVHKNGPDAKKQAFQDLLASQASLLFSASHGLWQAFNPADPDASFALQKKKMGALVCSDWDGKSQSVPDGACFYASDLPNTDLSGMMLFTFACYSAGVPRIPRFTDYPKAANFKPGRADFVSALPQAALRRGALAFIGHIDQSWGFSYVWNGKANIKNFESALGTILQGRRVGFAMEAFSQAYLDLNNQLTGLKGMINSYRSGADNGDEILETWMARQDAKSYIIVGDPAVRLDIDKLSA